MSWDLPPSIFYHLSEVSKFIIIYYLLFIIIIFTTTSKGTIMEIRSTRSFNAIPSTLIRGIFNF